MVKYCPYCGRNMPDDARICPYCNKMLGLHEGISQKPYTSTPEKKDKTVLIIAVVLVVILILPVAIAATVYVYFSNMLEDSSEGLALAPMINIQVKEHSKNNATISVSYIDKENILWSTLEFEIKDMDDNEKLEENINYTIYKPNGHIETGDEIELKGIKPEFEENHQYRLTMIYIPTDSIIMVRNWVQ